MLRVIATLVGISIIGLLLICLLLLLCAGVQLQSQLTEQKLTFSGVAAAAVSLQGHISGSRSNQYEASDPFMKPVVSYWASVCPGNGPDGVCPLAQSGNLQCVEFVTAAYFLAGDPLPTAPDAEQFWNVYASLPGWQRIPSPSAYPSAPAVSPNLGDLIVFGGGAHLEQGKLVEYGHIGIVVDFTAPNASHNGSIEIAEANGPGTKYPPLSTNPWIASDKPGNTYIMTVHPDYRIDTWGAYTLNGVEYSGMTVLGFLHHSQPKQAAVVFHSKEPERTHIMHIAPLLLLPLAKTLVVLRLLADDPTGVNTGMINLAKLLASFLGGTLALVLTYLGYQYLFTDAANHGAHVKKSILFILGGVILILSAVTLAPGVVTALQGK
jgi:hypothetical protein